MAAFKPGKISFVSSDAKAAKTARKKLEKLYDHVSPEKADVIIALGGDGTMLKTLHQFMDRDVPIYGMNRGSIGFLMNEFSEKGLLERLEVARPSHIHPHPLFSTRRDDPDLLLPPHHSPFEHVLCIIHMDAPHNCGHQDNYCLFELTN